jgi:hypothetical protein
MQVISTESLAPPPPWEQRWRKEGCRVRKTGQFVPGPVDPALPFFLFSKFFGSFGFRPELFWNFQISNQKKSGRKTFAPKIFTISNFRPENFPVFQISRPKKVRVFPARCRVSVARFTKVTPVNCLLDNLFSNFRANFFFFFSTFNPKNFTIFNVRAEKNPAHKLSNRKFLPGKNFRPCGQDTIGRKTVRSPHPLRRKPCTSG